MLLLAQFWKQICDKTPEKFRRSKNYVSFANKVAAISTTKFNLG